MSLVKELIDDLNRDLSGDEPRYGEDLYDDEPWPSEQELADDEQEDLNGRPC